MEAAANKPGMLLHKWIPLVLLLGLLVWQGWMTLGLFGSAAPWEQLTSAEPVLSGMHPLHQYHGYLGAQALLASGQSSCYDPAFQAGYPKTPIFDSGSRPAELFMLLAGGEYDPASYKIGLAATCLLVPLLLLVAAVSMGLRPWATLLATVFGLLVWWGERAQLLLHGGELDLLLTGLIILAHTGLLVQYDRSPGLFPWLGLLLTGTLGWFVHPLLFPLLLPLFLVYYLSAGVKHRWLSWHVALLAAQLGALAINFLWLREWVLHWWIRSPLPPSVDTLPHRTLRTIWEAPHWGNPVDRALAVLLMLSGLVGLVFFLRQKQRSAARLLGLGTLLLLLLALLGISWEPLGRVGTACLLIPGLWFAAIAAAQGWTAGISAISQCLPYRSVQLAAMLASGAVLGLLAQQYQHVVTARCQQALPLEIGLNAERRELVQTLLRETTSEARILWEDHQANRSGSLWSALLPLLTERCFMGGLDPQGQIEHSQAAFVRHLLAGKHISQWSDAALREYCRRYNIGWVIVWSPSAIERFRAWNDGAAEVAQVRDGQRGYLFRLRRDRPSFALHGQARVIETAADSITLADVVPQDGKVVLSFHHQTGLWASPSRVVIEREPDPTDAIPFVRLRLSSPVSRLTLRWQGP